MQLNFKKQLEEMQAQMNQQREEYKRQLDQMREDMQRNHNQHRQAQEQLNQYRAPPQQNPYELYQQQEPLQLSSKVKALLDPLEQSKSLNANSKFVPFTSASVNQKAPPIQANQAEVDSDFDRTGHYFDKEKSMGRPQQNTNAAIPDYNRDEEDIQALFKNISLANQQNSESQKWQKEAEAIKQEIM